MIVGTLLAQQGYIPPSGKADELHRFRNIIDHLARAGADGTSAAKEDNIFAGLPVLEVYNSASYREAED